MRKHSKKAIVGIGLMCVMVVAQAIAPLVAALVVGLHTLAGASLWYMKRDVRTSANAQPIVTYMKLVNTASEEDLPASGTFAGPTQSINRLSEGGTTAITVPAGAGEYTGGTVSGTVGEVINQLKYLPQPPFKYGQTATDVHSGFAGGQTAYSVAVSRRYGYFTPSYGASNCTTSACTARNQMTNYNSAPSSYTTGSNFGHYVQINLTTTAVNTGTTHYIVKGVEGATFTQCPAGYTANTTDPTKCDLTDAEAAKNQGTTQDGKCIISRGVPNPFDADCIAIRNAGGFGEALAADGTQYTTIKDPSGTDKAITAIAEKADGGKKISHTTTNADGSKTREDAETTPDGTVGAVSGANYPSTPPPTFPGDTSGGTSTTGGAVGGSTTTGTTGACGGPGQPACKVEIAQEGDGTEKNLEEVDCGDCDVNTEKKEGFLETVVGFGSLNITLPDATCKASFAEFDTTIEFGEADVSVVMSDVCIPITEHEELIKKLFLIGWTLLCIWIILEKTE